MIKRERGSHSNNDYYDLLSTMHYVANELTGPATIEYHDGRCIIRRNPANPEHARIYYELKSHGEHYVNTLYRIASFMLYEAKHAAKMEYTTSNVIPFPGASRFAGGVITTTVPEDNE